jgi:hypothetical protein
MLHREITAVYCEHDIRYINTLCLQDAEYVNVQAYKRKYVYNEIRAGPRYLGATDRLMIWSPIKPIFLKLFWLRTGLTNLFEGAEKFIRVWKPEFTNNHISHYYSDVLAPVIGWRSLQLPGWPAPPFFFLVVLRTHRSLEAYCATL